MPYVEPRHVEFLSELEPQLPSVLIEAILWVHDVGVDFEYLAR